MRERECVAERDRVRGCERERDCECERERLREREREREYEREREREREREWVRGGVRDIGEDGAGECVGVWVRVCVRDREWVLDGGERLSRES